MGTDTIKRSTDSEQQEQCLLLDRFQVACAAQRNLSVGAVSLLGVTDGNPNRGGEQQTLTSKPVACSSTFSMESLLLRSLRSTVASTARGAEVAAEPRLRAGE